MKHLAPLVAGRANILVHAVSPGRLASCAFLASDYATAMTGEVLYIDAGYHILGS